MMETEKVDSIKIECLHRGGSYLVGAWHSYTSEQTLPEGFALNMTGLGIRQCSVFVAVAMSLLELA
jgi:hypothetical protein